MLDPSSASVSVLPSGAVSVEFEASGSGGACEMICGGSGSPGGCCRASGSGAAGVKISSSEGAGGRSSD